MNPIMGGRKALASQDFYRVDSDYSKGRFPEALQIGLLTASLSLSSDLSAALLLYNAVAHSSLTPGEGNATRKSRKDYEQKVQAEVSH